MLADFGGSWVFFFLDAQLRNYLKLVYRHSLFFTLTNSSCLYGHKKMVALSEKLKKALVVLYTLPGFMLEKL